MNALLQVFAFGAGTVALTLITVGIADAAANQLQIMRRKTRKVPPVKGRSNQPPLITRSKYLSEFSCN